MIEIKKEFKKGEEEFLKYFETHKDFESLKEIKEESIKKEVKEFIVKLTEEIETLPEIKKEAEIHHESIESISNILANAINITLNEGLLEGLSFIKKTNNPYLIDAFHDLLTGHFFNLLLKYAKIKIIK